ncbi:uncharacterized protein [Watersipora subatra]|uniref:uncharacterized protein n=1 Tax=Watersipora subatra TaxID=2589382 RepID=UPI00355B9E47
MERHRGTTGTLRKVRTYAEMSGSTSKAAIPVPIMEKIARIARIDSEKLEVPKKFEVDFARLSADSRAAVSELVNAEAFRAAIEQLAKAQTKIASSKPAPMEGQADLDTSGPMSTSSSVVPSPVQPVTAEVETSYRMPASSSFFRKSVGKTEVTEPEVKESLPTQSQVSRQVANSGSSGRDSSDGIGGDRGHGSSAGREGGH